MIEGMTTLSRGAEVIRQAERGIRALLAEAASSAEYDELLVLADWVKQLRELLAGSGFGPSQDQLGPPPSSAVAGRDGPENTGAAMPVQSADSGAGKVSSHAGSRAGSGRAPRAQRRKGMSKGAKRTGSRVSEYPKFLRDGENLVKIGWSKKDKSPYEHRAPKRVVDLLVETLVRAGRDGRRFTTDDILPLHDPDEGAEIPSYQGYLCLAWLRREKKIEQHGRKGYSLLNAERLPTLVAECWDGMSRR
jgi:hypothetical protein